MVICLKKDKQFFYCITINKSNTTVYSQANHIEQLRALRESTKLEMQKLHSYHTYTNNSYFGN